MTTVVEDQVKEQYQQLVQSFVQAEQVAAPQEMVANFTQLIQNASPETLTDEQVLGLVTMGQQFLDQQQEAVRAGQVDRQEVAALQGQFHQAAGYLLSQATWLGEAARQALQSFAAGKEVETEAAAVPEASSRTRERVGERYARSRELLERARRVIPSAAQTYSKSYREFPAQAAPLFLERGHGAQVWDVDGNRYVDLMGALMPISLGYCDPDVDEAIRRQLERGINLSLTTELQVEVAEELVELIPCAEMVRFAKNGSDVTGAAVRLARAATGRDRIAFCGYHGHHDWYVGATSERQGVPEAVSALTHPFLYNNLAYLEELLDRHPGEFAAVIMEPMRRVKPAPGFLEGCRDLIHKHGGLLIFDEIITGFRFHLQGAQGLFGVVPDLATYSKSLANGMPLSVLAGPAELMKRLDGEVFFSITYGGESLSLAATQATLRKMRREPVIETLWTRGDRLVQGVRGELARWGLEQRIQLTGAPCCPYLEIRDGEGADAAELRALLLQELLARGVLLSRNHVITYALTDPEVDEVVAAYGDALAEVAGALAEGDLTDRLADRTIHRVPELQLTLTSSQG